MGFTPSTERTSTVTVWSCFTLKLLTRTLENECTSLAWTTVYAFMHIWEFISSYRPTLWKLAHWKASSKVLLSLNNKIKPQTTGQCPKFHQKWGTDLLQGQPWLSSSPRIYSGDHLGFDLGRACPVLIEQEDTLKTLYRKILFFLGLPCKIEFTGQWQNGGSVIWLFSNIKFIMSGI